MKNKKYSRNYNLVYKFVIIVVLILCIVLPKAGATEEQTADTNMKPETKTSVLTKEKEEKMLCEKVSMLIKNKTIEKYALGSVGVPDIPKTDEYINLDVDGDDISDKVIRSCGTGECGLEIKLSGGGEIEFDTSPFFLIRIGGQTYILVGVGNLSKPRKNLTFGLYILNEKGVELICDTYKERR